MYILKKHDIINSVQQTLSIIMKILLLVFTLFLANLVHAENPAVVHLLSYEVVLSPLGRPCIRYGTSMNDSKIICEKGEWHRRMYIVKYKFKGTLKEVIVNTLPPSKIQVDANGNIIEVNTEMSGYH